MKKSKIKFIKKSSIFLVILISLLLLINLAYVKSIQEKKAVYRKELSYQNYLENLPEKEIDFAFFGSSHTGADINPKFIPGSFNFASNAENYIKTYYKLDRLLNKDNIKINNIALELDLNSFSSALTEDEKIFDEIWLYSEFIPLKEISAVRDEPLVNLWLEANLPLLGNGKELAFLIKKPELAEIYLGWNKNANNFSSTNKTTEATNRYNVMFNNKEQITDKSIEYFLKTLELAKEKDINIIFIKYPISKEYDNIITEKGIDTQGYYDLLFKEINSAIGEDYSVLDYYPSFFDRPEYLADPDHLNYLGAELFSKEVLLDLQAI